MNWTELHPLIHEAGRTTLAVGFLVMLVLLCRRPFARRFGAKAAYALWTVPLIRFVMPPMPGNWSLAGLLGFDRQNAAPPDLGEFVFVDGGHRVGAMPLPIAEPHIPAQPSIIDASASPSLLEGVTAVVASNIPLLLTSVWLLGALLWLGISLRKQDVFQRLIWDDSEPASHGIRKQAQLVANQIGLKKVPAVRISLLCSGPLVTGLKAPVVLLPYWFEDDYTRDEQRDALVHELMHLKRRDLWAFQAARIVAATQWFNPFVHLGLKAFRTDQEAACDADVLRQDRISPAAYGRTLVKAARLARPSDRRIAAASLTLAHPIKERLIMMQHPTPSFRSRLTGTTLAVAIGSAAIFATASCMSAQAEEKQTRTYVFNSDHGADSDRQMVILSDPFAKLQPKLSAIGEMDFGAFDMDFEMEDFDMSFATEGLEALEGLERLEGLENLLELSNIMSFSTDDEDGKQVFVMKMGETPEDFEERIEEWAEKIEERSAEWEAKVEAHAEEMERRAEVMSIRIEKRAEEWAAKHEAKAAEWEAKIEATFDDEFEAEMEAAGEAVENLAAQCDARSSDDPTPEIVTATDAKTGDTYRALCVNGDRETLKADSLADWVNGRSDLTDAEKATFIEKRDHRQDIKITIGEFEHDSTADEEHRIIIKRAHRSETHELEGGDEQ